VQGLLPRREVPAVSVRLDLAAERDGLARSIATTAQAGLDDRRYAALLALVVRHWPHQELLTLLFDHGPNVGCRGPMIFASGSPGLARVCGHRRCDTIRAVHFARVREHYEHLHGQDARWQTTLADSLRLQWSTLLAAWMTDGALRDTLARLSRHRIDG
jgi:hypothetical protein